MTTDSTVLRPALGRIAYVVVMAMCALAIGSLLLSPAADRVASIAALPVALAGIGWVTLMAPCIVIAPDGIEIRNPLRTIRVGHGAVRDIATRHGFTVVTDEGDFQAWGAPAPGRLGSLGDLLSRDPAARGADPALRDPRIKRDADAVRSSAMPGTLSGDAAMTLAHHAAEADAAQAADARVEREWNRVNLIVLAVSIAAAAMLAPL